MPATYSINVGTAIEAYRKPDIISVLKDLPNNTHKLISPRNVRDAFFSVWASSPFKQTTNLAGIEYIGIDSGNPSNRDIKQKILIGKRSYANLDIMSDSLLSNEAPDIYFYNTKPDSYLTQSVTKVAILAGTNSSLYGTAPYIESRVDGLSNHFEIRNPSLNKGPISIFSATGRVAINGILFPTVAETATASGAANGRILKYSGSYPNGYLKWSDITFDETNVGMAGLPTNIYGSPVRLNGYSLEFVDGSVVPLPVGGVPSGFSFSSNTFYNPTGATYQNWPLSEVLRKIIYPYVEPSVSIRAINNTAGQPSAIGTSYSKANATANVSLTYDITIYPRTPDEYVSNYYILTHQKWASNIVATAGTPYSGLSFSGLPGKTFSTTLSLNASSAGGVSGGQFIYTIAISNVPGTTIAGYPLSAPYLNFGWSYSATTTMNFIKPLYYGFISATVSAMPAAGLTELIKPYPGPSASMSLNINGTGYLHFAYPAQNGIGGNPSLTALKSIKDPNGFSIHSSSAPGSSAFTYSTISGWHVYRTVNICSYTGDYNFEFTF
jgi:hypothetical protein